MKHPQQLSWIFHHLAARNTNLFIILLCTCFSENNPSIDVGKKLPQKKNERLEHEANNTHFWKNGCRKTFSKSTHFYLVIEFPPIKKFELNHFLHCRGVNIINLWILRCWMPWLGWKNTWIKHVGTIRKKNTSSEIQVVGRPAVENAFGLSFGTGATVRPEMNEFFDPNNSWTSKEMNHRTQTSVFRIIFETLWWLLWWVDDLLDIVLLVTRPFFQYELHQRRVDHDWVGQWSHWPIFQPNSETHWHSTKSVMSSWQRDRPGPQHDDFKIVVNAAAGIIGSVLCLACQILQ